MACLALVAEHGMEWLSPDRKLHWPIWVFNALYVPVYLTVAVIALFSIALLITPKLPINLLGLRFDQQGWLTMSGIVFSYLLLFDF